MANKTKKLFCCITGRPLVLSRDYYAKKLKKCNDDEELLKTTYVCKEAKTLIKRGYDVVKTRDLLGITDIETPVSEELIETIRSESRIKYRNLPKFNINNYTSAKTDPEVTEFLKKVFKKNNI